MVQGVTRIKLPLPSDQPLATGTRQHATFVAGPENRLLVPVLERLLSGNDLSTICEWISPLVLFGPSGAGKSALAQAIVRHWAELLDAERVAYLTASDFARQLRNARTEGELVSYRQWLAELQLLVIENIEQLPQRLAVQRELRDALEYLCNKQSLVVVTSNVNPTCLPTLEPGLRDRLSEGLSLAMKFPGLEARIELLQLAAGRAGMQISFERLQKYAHRLQGSAPQVLSSLAQLDLEKSVGRTGDDAGFSLTLKQVLVVVARYFSLTQAALCSSNRHKSLVYARGVVVYLARELTSLSYAQIGQGLGRRDHTTIMHAYRSIEKLLNCDMTVQQNIEELQRILTAR